MLIILTGNSNAFDCICISMMNYIWAFMMLFSLVSSIFNGTEKELTAAVFDGAAAALSLCVKLLSSLCLWCGMMNIAEQSGLCSAVAKLLRPLIVRLFPSYSSDKSITDAVTMNVTANLLGLGNAATPSGIEAVRRMQIKNGDKTLATTDMMVFVVINTAALRIIPTTVAALRQSAGATAPMDIIVCVWISSVLSQIVAVGTVKIMGRLRRK